jgi:hypothetical protein
VACSDDSGEQTKDKDRDQIDRRMIGEVMLEGLHWTSFLSVELRVGGLAVETGGVGSGLALTGSAPLHGEVGKEG